MPVRKANAIWEGNLIDGKGTVEVEYPQKQMKQKRAVQCPKL